MTASLRPPLDTPAQLLGYGTIITLRMLTDTRCS